jgi:hypothetical protein
MECEGQLQECTDAVLEELRRKKPEMGKNIAIDGSSLPAYANGQGFITAQNRRREPGEYSDPDASWGFVPRSLLARPEVSTATSFTWP